MSAQMKKVWVLAAVMGVFAASGVLAETGDVPAVMLEVRVADEATAFLPVPAGGVARVGNRSTGTALEFQMIREEGEPHLVVRARQQVEDLVEQREIAASPLTALPLRFTHGDRPVTVRLLSVERKLVHLRVRRPGGPWVRGTVIAGSEFLLDLTDKKIRLALTPHDIGEEGEGVAFTITRQGMDGGSPVVAVREVEASVAEGPVSFTVEEEALELELLQVEVREEIA